MSTTKEKDSEFIKRKRKELKATNLLHQRLNRAMKTEEYYRFVDKMYEDILNELDIGFGRPTANDRSLSYVSGGKAYLYTVYPPGNPTYDDLEGIANTIGSTDIVYQAEITRKFKGVEFIVSGSYYAKIPDDVMLMLESLGKVSRDVIPAHESKSVFCTNGLLF